MSVKTLHNRELFQLGYMALISIALAFTTIKVATASTTNLTQAQSSLSNPLDACLLHGTESSSTRRPMCASDTQASSVESFQALTSAFQLDIGRPLQSTNRPTN